MFWMAKVRGSWVRKVCTAFSISPFCSRRFRTILWGRARDVEGFAVLHRHYCLASSDPSDISPELPSLSDTAIAARCIICSPLLSCFASCVKKMDSLTNECYGFLCFIQLRSKSVYLDGAIDLYWMAHIWNFWNKTGTKSNEPVLKM